MLLNNVARILELSLPLMDHPSESFLAQLEEDMTKLIFKHGMTVSLSNLMMTVFQESFTYIVQVRSVSTLLHCH